MAEITPLTNADINPLTSGDPTKKATPLTAEDINPPTDNFILSEDEKINFNIDTIYQLQEKTNSETLPFIDEPTQEDTDNKFQTAKSWMYGWYSGKSHLTSFQAHVFNNADEAADDAIELFGNDRKKWEYEYLYGSEFAQQNNLLTSKDFNNLEQKLKEKDEFRKDLNFTSTKVGTEKPKNALTNAVYTSSLDTPSKQALADLFTERFLGKGRVMPLSARLGAFVFDKQYRYETLVGLDSYIDLLREKAVEEKPKNYRPDYFGRFEPEGVWEKTIAGFGQAPADLLILGGATALTRSPAYGFGLVAAIESSDEGIKTTAYNTAKGMIEGKIIGSIAHQPTWKRRVTMFGMYGSGNAWWHGGQFDDIVSSGIVMASFGIVGPGKVTDTAGLTNPKSRLNKEGEVISIDPKAKGVNEQGITVYEVNGAERISLDIKKLDSHAEPVKQFINTKDTSGFKREIEPQILEADVKSLSVKEKSSEPTTHLDNMFSIKGKKGTDAAIKRGDDYIPFEVVKETTKSEYKDPMYDLVETKDGRIESKEGAPSVKETIIVPRETVIKNGKFLDTYFSVDGTGKIIKIADITTRSDAFNPRGNRWAIESAEATGKRILEKEKQLNLDKAREDIVSFDSKGKPIKPKKSKVEAEPEVKILDPLGETGLEKFQTVAFADAYGFKLANDGSVILKYSDLVQLKNKKDVLKESLNKKNNKWIANAIKEADVLIENRNSRLDKRVNNYDVVLKRSRMGLNDHLTSAIEARPNLGDTNVRRHEHLEASIYENVNVKEPTRKTGEDGRPVETDITPEAAPGKIGMFNQMLKKGLTFVEMNVLAPKFIGDQKRNSILNFAITRTDNIMFRETRALLEKLLYRSEIKFDPKSIDTAKYVVQENSTIRLPFVVSYMKNALGKIVPIRGKTGALTLFEQLYRTGKDGIIQTKQVVDSIRERSFEKEAEARANVKGNKTKEKVNAEYLKKNADGTFKYQMSYAEMKTRFKLNDLQIQIVEAMDIGLRNMLNMYNQSVRKYKDQSNAVIVERPNYDIRSWLGSERAFITAKKDVVELGIKEGDLVVALPGKNTKELKTFVNFFLKENPMYANTKKFKLNYVKKQRQLTRDNVKLIDVFQEIHKFAQLTNPEAMAAIKATEIAFAKKTTSFKPTLERKGTRGFSGERPGREGVQDYWKSYIDYMDGGVKAIKMMEWKDKVEPMLYNKNFLKDFPQQMKTSKAWIDNALGREPGRIAKLIDDVTTSVGNRIGNADALPWMVRTGNKVTLYKNLLFFNIRFANAQLVQPLQVLAPALKDMQVNYNIKGDIGFSLLNGTYLTFRATKEFSELIVLASESKNKTLDDKYLREFGVDPTSGRDLRTRNEEMAYLIKDVGLGKNLTGMLERHSRLQALATYYSFLKSAKYDKTHGKEAMFEQAMRQTDNLMVEYDARHRAVMYGNKGLGGTLGNFMGLFKTFQHNYFGKTAKYIRTARENGVKGIEPLVGHFTMQIMTAGLLGVMAIEQVDSIIEYINAGKAKFLKSPKKLLTATELILTSDTLSIGEKFGMPSVIAGFDISSTLQAPGLSINDIASFPTASYLFGWGDNRHNGVLGEFATNLLPKLATNTVNDVDTYRFLKITLPPVLQAPLDQYYAKMPWREYPEAFGIVPPNKTIHYTDDHATFYTRDKDRYVVRDPFKNMSGKLRRNAKDFLAVWFSGKSFEESLVTRALWANKKISNHIKDVKTANVTGAAIALVDGNQPVLMYHVFALMEMGYSQDAAFKMITTRIKNMDDTAMNRIKALSQQYNMDTADFLDSVIHNNKLSGDIMPGFRYGTIMK